MFFNRAVSALLLPPGIFIALGVILFLLRNRVPSKIRMVLSLGLPLCLYLLSIRPMEDLLLYPLESRYSKVKSSSEFSGARYIVVLGGGSVSRESESSLSTSGMTRLMEGVILYRQLDVPLIFCGGKTIQGAEWPSEAEIASDTMRKLGVPEKDILLEETSRNTYENLKNMMALYSPESFVLVTSAYHMPRTMILLREYEGVKVIPHCVDYKVEHRRYSLLDFLPSMGALNSSYRALHEYMGLVYYALRYS